MFHLQLQSICYQLVVGYSVKEKFFWETKMNKQYISGKKQNKTNIQSHGGSDSEESACNAGDPGYLLWSRISPGEGNGNPLQYSCLENSMAIGAWWVPRSHKESDMTERLTLQSHVINSCSPE